MLKKTSNLLFRFILAAALLAASLSEPAFAFSSAARSKTTTIGVDTFVDDTTANGNCTLREAIQAANTDQAVDNCPAGSDPDTILLPAGTYRLDVLGRFEDEAQSGDLDITGDLELIGDGWMSTIIDANGIDRVLHVLGGSEVNIYQLTITGGDTDTSAASAQERAQVYDGVYAAHAQTFFGAGAYVEDAILRLYSTRITGNVFGGGISGSGSSYMHLQDSRLDNNTNLFSSGGGLGVAANASAYVLNSTLHGNHSAHSGGGIANAGTLVATNSTISTNSALGHGGGLLNQGEMALFNITISANTTGADPQINGDGGGVYQARGLLYLRNTIIGENFDLSSTGDTSADCAGQITGGGYNLISDMSGCSFTGRMVGNLTGVDPLLSPLMDNGGPTWTHALLAGSPAIDAGNPSGCTVQEGSTDLPLTFDQRGFLRPSDGDGNGSATCDIGAFEHAPVAAPPPTETPDPAEDPSEEPPVTTPTPTNDPDSPKILFLPLVQH